MGRGHGEGTGAGALCTGTSLSLRVYHARPTASALGLSAVCDGKGWGSMTPPRLCHRAGAACASARAHLVKERRLVTSDGRGKARSAGSACVSRWWTQTALAAGALGKAAFHLGSVSSWRASGSAALTGARGLADRENQAHRCWWTCVDSEGSRRIKAQEKADLSVVCREEERPGWQSRDVSAGLGFSGRRPSPVRAHAWNSLSRF